MENRDEEFYKELYSQIQRPAQRYLLRSYPTTNPADIDEIINQAFEIFFRQLSEEMILIDETSGVKRVKSKNGGDYPPESYLFGIIKNLKRDTFKKLHQTNFDVIDEEDLNSPPNLIYNPVIETRILLKEFWAILDSEEKYIFELKLAGHKYENITKKFNARFRKNMTEAALRKLFQRKIREVAKKFL